MKADTKKKLFAIFIILSFALSSVAFVFNLFGGGGLPQEQQFKPLDSFLINGRLDSRTETAYVQAGFTSMRYYYDSDALLYFIDQLPQMTSTNTGQVQLIVQKIPANETYAEIVTLNDAEEVRDVTGQNIVAALCRLLSEKPLECIQLNVSA